MMLGSFICKKLLYVNVKCALSASLNNKFCYPKKHPSLLLSIKYLSTTCNQHSFTVSYLINSCGFSTESALLASKRVHFESPERPDSVIDFFMNQGFSKLQISRVIRCAPHMLLANIEKTLLSKIEILHSKSVSSPDIVKIISSYPSILSSSLDNRINPTFNFIKNLLQSDEKTIRAIKRWPGILCCDPESYLMPNINVLQNIGVPHSRIVTLLGRQPRTLLMTPKRFNENVEDVKAKGFNPLGFNFVEAICVSGAMTKLTWERKVDAYERWGWSKEEILVAFKKRPMCMMVSENKIVAAMDFLINKMGCESSYIAQHSILISLSLDKRIVPRCSVIQVLLSKGLINRFSLASSLKTSEKLFLQRYVTSYEDQAPHLLKLYQENMDLSNK